MSFILKQAQQNFDKSSSNRLFHSGFLCCFGPFGFRSIGSGNTIIPRLTAQKLVARTFHGNTEISCRPTRALCHQTWETTQKFRHTRQLACVVSCRIPLLLPLALGLQGTASLCSTWGQAEHNRHSSWWHVGKCEKLPKGIIGCTGRHIARRAQLDVAWMVRAADDPTATLHCRLPQCLCCCFAYLLPLPTATCGSSSQCEPSTLYYTIVAQSSDSATD